MSVCFFKYVVVLGFLISLMNFGTDIASVFKWGKTQGEYDSRSAEMVEAIEGDGMSNFQANSTWFLALSTEYEASSDFDKKNIYCDVITLQGEPDEFLNDGQFIQIMSSIFIVQCAFSFMVGWCYLFWLLRKTCHEHSCEEHCQHQKRMQQYHSEARAAAAAAAKAAGITDPEVANSKIPGQKRVGTRQQKREFMRYRAIAMFCAIGPMLAVNWLIVTRLNATNGHDCHEKFFDCGVAGSCTIDDLTVPVALNSSYLDLITSNILMMLAIGSGVLDIAFTFLASLALYARDKDFKYIILPFFVLVLSLISALWLFFLDDMVAGLDSSIGILAFGHIPMLLLLIYGCVGMYRANKEEDFYGNLQFPQMNAEQKAEMQAKQRKRIKKDCFYVCCCVWCGPCCQPRPRRPAAQTA